MDDAIRYALNNFSNLLKEGHNLESARDFLLHKIGMNARVVTAAIAEHHRLARGYREFWEPRVLADGTAIPEPWYKPSEDDIFWPELYAHLNAKEGWNGAPLTALDQGSSKVVSYVQPPYAVPINTRGLVVGYVQSGKTSNFTAVISKAADAGYRLFIVLSGLHNNLRRQTQLRLEEQLVNLNEHRWLPLTSETGDFGDPVKATPLLAQKDLRLLAVVKKHSLRLNNLIGWLNRAHEAHVLNKCPILVIDDEADQASPNTRKAEQKRAVINECIIKLLSFPKVAYVGYTATPFANFFIDPTFPEDLYPRHFICDLPMSPDYFGPESLFGREPRTADEPEVATLDMIRLVDHSELAELVPPRKKGASTTFQPAVTASLRLALRWFLLAATARRIRAGEPKHTTMLIHTSDRVLAHNAMWQPVADELKSLKHSLQSVDKTVLTELREQWESESKKVDGAAWGHTPIPPNPVIDGMADTIALLGNLDDRDSEECGLVVDNSYSFRRLVYDDEKPLPLIVIGGNTLSRGLTLEGLVSSFFVRRGATYDTLLQMGRWFGYRRGYEDLPRMWVTAELKRQFRTLATVEDQIRSEITRYEELGLLPIQVPVRVRKTKGLAITALNKRYYTKSLKISYSGQRPQTILFSPDTAWLQRNLKATRTLLKACVDERREMADHGNRVVIRDVPASAVLEFFDKESGYQFHEGSTELNTESLLNYVAGQNKHGQLGVWNIAVISRHEPLLDNTDCSIELGLKRKINLIGRSKLSDASDSTTVNIGVLTNQVDWVADLDVVGGAASKSLSELRQMRNNSGRAVLLIYPIARNSPAKTTSRTDDEKVQLDVDEDVIGVSVAFPWGITSDDVDDGYEVVKLPEHSPDLSAEGDEEEDEDDEPGSETDDGEGNFDDTVIKS
ncbi:Z1 domain-containing protein [Mycolicibacterium gadium]|uniref:Putative endonuclease Z1 domain-containing protein n=1 Tax=Mycolicibacterium gadium TaxID=1794 RepID=A0A7I7WVX9_MYCGU|nr:Z1 domain-containing protein [Mycolicibacterium gadium]BBZ20887.1 hypothetical protein MGAD_52220 [Mycolicibacterium gadium]